MHELMGGRTELRRIKLPGISRPGFLQTDQLELTARCFYTILNLPLHLDKFLACGIGSLPYSSPQEASDIILRYLFGEDIPFRPQLP